jgi:hypothetical protein
MNSLPGRYADNYAAGVTAELLAGFAVKSLAGFTVKSWENFLRK